MDFLDFLDLQTNDKKSDRMRSWYLYEQYKSLEKHQLDAAEKLKNRSYQERLLLRELAERRARRRLYQPAPAGLRDRPDCARSRDDATHLSTTTTEDFYETFCELHDEFRTADPVSDCEESEPDAELEKAYMENFPCIDELRNETTCTESVNSVTEKSATFTKKSLADKLEAVQRNIAENINLQLDTVKENMLCLEKYAMSDGDKTSVEELSVESLERSSGKAEALDKSASVLDNSMFTMWTRMVSFAYQVIQLNHGNCYYDYSSQLMTAVLACDILRRGFNRMCRILQPYVSPIKLCTESDESDECAVTNSYKNAKRKKCLALKKNRKSSQQMINSSVRKTFVSRRSGGNCYSDNLWRHCSKYSVGNVQHERNHRRGSEPWREMRRHSSGSSGSFWPRDLDSDRASPCHCCCHKKVLNPMLKLVRYLDEMLKSDVHDFVDR